MVRIQYDFLLIGVLERLASRDWGTGAFGDDAGATVESGKVASED